MRPQVGCSREKCKDGISGGRVLRSDANEQKTSAQNDAQQSTGILSHTHEKRLQVAGQAEFSN